MEVDISSLIDKRKSPGLMGQTSRSEGRINRSKAIESTPESKDKSVSKDVEPQADIKTLGNNKIDYLVDHETNDVVIRIVDKESGEVVRQIPGEEFLRFTNRISNFDQKYLDETV